MTRRQQKAKRICLLASAKGYAFENHYLAFHNALNAIGCKRIFEDRGSGASTERSGLKACLDHLRRGDVLLALDLDRLGRLAGELIRLVDELEGAFCTPSVNLTAPPR